MLPNLSPDDGQCYRAEIQRKQFGWGHYNYSFSHYIPQHGQHFSMEQYWRSGMVLT